MGKVAAVQMTSSHVVADNLAFAAGLLREAKDAGAEIACLPENFSFIGLKDADKLQVAEKFGDGLVQAFLSDTARELDLWILGGTIVIRTGSSDSVKIGASVAEETAICAIEASASTPAMRPAQLCRASRKAWTAISSMRAAAPLAHPASTSTMGIPVIPSAPSTLCPVATPP